MTPTQEKAITLSLNILHVGFFECTGQHYQYFIDNDEWALLMSAAGVNDVNTPPQAAAVAALRNAVLRAGFFADMTDFRPPAHHCSFLRDRIDKGKLKLTLHPCQEGQQGCPYATFENLKSSK